MARIVDWAILPANGTVHFQVQFIIGGPPEWITFGDIENAPNKLKAFWESITTMPPKDYSRVVMAQVVGDGASGEAMEEDGQEIEDEDESDGPEPKEDAQDGEWSESDDRM